MASTQKLDLMKLRRQEYAPSKKPVLLDVKPAKYLTVMGTGAPGGEAFQAAIGALYSAAYTIKMAWKFAGNEDYKVATLQAQWWNAPQRQWLPGKPPESWGWRLMILTPDFITEKELEDAAGKLKARKKPLPAKVRLEEIEEGKCVQALHVGPYSEEEKTIELMRQFAEASGLSLRKKHHEIYFSDPRRVAPEKLRTLLRVPVR
jgi:hypothetical protein